MNSRKHAVLAKTIAIDGEDPAEFEELLRSLVEEFTPKPGCEYELVVLLATNFWRLRRIPRFEARSLRTQESKIIYRDPRVDKLVEQEAMRRKFVGEMAVRFGAKPSESTDEDDEKTVRAKFDALLPSETAQGLLSPSEAQEMLAKMARYETALVNSISRTLNMLIGIQNMYTERAEHRGLKLVSQGGLAGKDPHHQA